MSASAACGCQGVLAGRSVDVRSPSTLHGSGPSNARPNAPAAAEKTEASRADFTPVPIDMPMANDDKSTPLASAAHRV